MIVSRFNAVLAATLSLGAMGTGAQAATAGLFEFSGSVVVDHEYGGGATNWFAALDLSTPEPSFEVDAGIGGFQSHWGDPNVIGTGSFLVTDSQGEALAHVTGGVTASLLNSSPETIGFDSLLFNLGCFPVLCEVISYPKQPNLIEEVGSWGNVRFRFASDTTSAFHANGSAGLAEVLSIISAGNVAQLTGATDLPAPLFTSSAFVAANIDGNGGFLGTLTAANGPAIAPVPLPASQPMLLGALGIAGIIGRRRVRNIAIG